MTPYYSHAGIDIYLGDVMERMRELPDESVHCVVTSPPYWGLRDYGCDGQIGLEATPAEYIAKMVAVFREVRRVLRNDGTCWVNIGDSYAHSQPGRNRNGTGGQIIRPYGDESLGRVQSGDSSKHHGVKDKDLIGIPWHLAFALQADGWWLRQDIIWSKLNPMPESVTDRCTKAHEYIFMLTKSSRYYYDSSAIAEEAIYQPGDGGGNQTFGAAGGKAEAVYGAKVSGKVWERNRTRNKRDVWEIATEPFPEAHFATFPTALVKPCILAGCPSGGTVLDPFGGAMTTMLVAGELNCKGIAIELNSKYIEIGKKRLSQEVFDWGETA